MTDANIYLPLFRKYRPQSFKDVIGQEFTTKALINAIKLNKIANAYLFCGPRGTGKTSSARIFAKSLNCVNGPTDTPCQKCQSCIDVTNAAGIDVIEIDAATNRGIEDAKELISQVQYAPMNGKYKIFIIDEVHMLSKEAFNALLKTFEEPPKNVIFILATTEPHKVIETIVSRCQRFDFRRITIEDIVKRLREISNLENINITDDALFSIAKNVSGGMRDSLALLDQASILGTEKQITKETIEMLIGKLTFDVLYNLTCDIFDKNTEKAVAEVETIYEKGSEPRNFAENYIEFLRNAILAATSSDIEACVNLTLFDKKNIEKIKSNPHFTKEALVFALDKTIEFYKEIKVSTNPYLWAELMVISLSSPHSAANLATCASQFSAKPAPTSLLKQEAQQAASAPASSAPAPVQEKAAPSIPNQTAKSNPENKPSLEPAIQETPKVFYQKAELEQKAETETAPEQASKQEPAPIHQKETSNIPPAQENPITGSAALQAGLDPAATWTEIINKIESIPAKFFYSGVGKLVNIAGAHITLGFVNENAIAQAKSDNKYKPLIKAMQSVLGSNASIEFITITKDTKILAAHVSVKTTGASQNTMSTPSVPAGQNEIQGPQNMQKPARGVSSQTGQDSFAAPASNTSNSVASGVSTQAATSNSSGDDSIKQEDLANYTKTTREMLEAYNGRIIE